MRLRKVKVHGAPKQDRLNEIEDVQPVKAIRFMIRVQEQNHSERHRRGDKKQVIEAAQRFVGMKLIVGSQALADTPHHKGKGHEPPEIPAQTAGASRGLEASRDAQDSERQLQEIG